MSIGHNTIKDPEKKGPFNEILNDKKDSASRKQKETETRYFRQRKGCVTEGVLRVKECEESDVKFSTAGSQGAQVS